MGFTTFSTQNNIYFDLETITVYLLGDLVIIYVVALLVCAAIENQIIFIFNYVQHRVFGKENKYSILLLEEWKEWNHDTLCVLFLLFDFYVLKNYWVA